LLGCAAGGVEMHYSGMAWTAGNDELAPEETRNIPFFGFVAGTIISLGLWLWIAWTIWVVVD